MAVSTTTNRISYSGNGSTTAFSYPYYFQSSSDLVVILRVTASGVETTKTITTHYTVSGTATNNVYPSGGTVTMVTAPASGETLTIYADPTKTQTVDLVANDSLPAETTEQALDKLTMVTQRLSNRMDRAVRQTEGDATSLTLTLPSPVASRLIGWDSGGTALSNYAAAGNLSVSSYMETVLDDTTAGAARTTLDAQQLITSLTADTSPSIADDSIITYDASASASKKVSLLNLVAAITPPGTVLDYAGTSAPTGFLLCDGSAVSRTTYAALFAVVSTTYNTGGEAGTDFRLPDLRGRVVAGKDNMGGSAANRITVGASGITGTTLGAAGGTETHTLTEAQLASHTHIFKTSNGAESVDGTYYVPTYVNRVGGQNSYYGAGVNNPATAGSGSAHQNTQPTMILNKIIKT